MKIIHTVLNNLVSNGATKPQSHTESSFSRTSRTLSRHSLLAFALTGLFVLFGLATKAESNSESLSTFKIEQSSSTLQNWKASTFDRQRLSGLWKLGLTLDSYTEGLSEALTTQFKAQGNAHYVMSEQFDFLLTAGVSARAGRVQENYERTGTGNSLFLKEALIRYSPYSEVKLDAGVVGQGHFSSDLLISSSASFPGLRQSYERMFGDMKLKVWGQQVVPTSSSFDTDRVQKESFPTLLTQTIELSSKAIPGYDLASSLTLFDFDNLPSKVAFDSFRLGNTISEQGVGTSRFSYDFRGVMLSGDIALLSVAQLPIYLRPSLLRNLAADTGFSTAQNITLGTRIQSQGSTYEPYGSYYFAESDATVAAYSSGRYGQTNREGFFLGVRSQLPKYGFAVNAEFGRLNTINQSSQQDRIDTVMIQLETLNARF